MRFSKLAARKAQLLLLQQNDQGVEVEADEIDPRPEMLCFRAQTLALVRHFFELSCQVGRLSSLLGREFFRARVSHHAIPSFEEQAVFVRDIELCFAKLSDEHAEIITLVGLYDYTHEEVAQMLRYSKTMVHCWFSNALDALSEIFLQAGLLSEDRPDRHQRQVTNRELPPYVEAYGKKPPQSAGIAPEGRDLAAEGESPGFRCRPVVA
jgi:hypothetical protein